MSAGEVDLDQAHELMMAVLDGEASEQQRLEFDALLARQPGLAAEWQRLQRVKEVTATLTIMEPPEEAWDRYRRTVSHRAERGVAWVLIAVGVAIPASIAVSRWLERWFSSDVPVLVMVSTAALIGGLMLLLFSVLRERWHMHRRDPYSKGVVR